MQRTEKATYWRSHLSKSRESSLGATKYCRLNGLNLATFNYWKNKRVHEGPGPLKVSPAFVTLEVEKVERALPDPKWLAEFTVELVRGFFR